MVDVDLVGIHWSPVAAAGGAAACGLPSLDGSRFRNCLNWTAARAPSTGMTRADDAEDDEATASPISLRGPTVVIWHRPDCGACRLSEPLFRALERSALPPAFVEVRRRVATRAALRRYPAHLTSLPLYDFVWPGGGPPPPAVARPAPRGGPHPYGADAAVETVRNNDVARIRQLVPALNTPSSGPG